MFSCFNFNPDGPHFPNFFQEEELRITRIRQGKRREPLKGTKTPKGKEDRVNTCMARITQIGKQRKNTGNNIQGQRPSVCYPEPRFFLSYNSLLSFPFGVFVLFGGSLPHLPHPRHPRFSFSSGWRLSRTPRGPGPGRLRAQRGHRRRLRTASSTRCPSGTRSGSRRGGISCPCAWCR
jgi:hypothetical protein